MKRQCAISMLVLLAASGLSAQDLYFTGTTSNQICVAPRDGSGTATVLFDNAASSTQGPAGMVVVLDTVQKIFYTGGNEWEIDVANVDGSGTPSVLWGSQECCEHLGVTVNAATGVLFWTTENAGDIRSGNLDGSGVVADVYSGLSDYPVGITYDPATDGLIWTSVSGQSLSAGSASGGDPIVLFDDADGVTRPRQVVLDKTNRLIYWTQHTNSAGTGQIMVGNADGSGTPAELFTVPDPFYPWGIDVDDTTGTLYWTEHTTYSGSSDRIMSGNADGSGSPTVLYAGDFGSVRGIAAAANLVPVELMSLSVE